jgi:hypothetical protein
MAANRVVDALYRRFGKPLPQDRAHIVALLFTITSFEFFDSFAGNQRPETVCAFILRFVMDAMGIPA